MERKTAISVLKDIKNWAEKDKRIVYAEALTIAINSLMTDEAYQLEYEQPEFCEDCISRKEAISWIENLRTLNEHYHPNAKDNNLIDCDSAIDHLKQVPSILPKEPTTKNNHHKKNIQAYAHDFGVSEEQAEKELRVPTKNDLGVDCISRADAIHAISEALERTFVEHEDIANKLIGNLPSVTPQEPRKGHWIGHREHCENLGVMPSGLGAYEWCSNCDCGIDVREWHRNHYNFCPNCGADMREVEE